MDYYGDARVTLITCKGPFNPSAGTSDNRIVATFKEVSVFVVPDPPIAPFPPLEG
jgi:sortase (surface protein transpeptidase)